MKHSRIIYVADDDEDDRLFISDALLSLNLEIRIIEVGDGLDLLNRIQSERMFHTSMLVILDMNMPKVTGLEALAAIRANHRIKHIPAVMISTSSDSELIRKAYQTGVNAFIKKPNTIDGFTRIAEALQTCFFDHHHL